MKKKKIDQDVKKKKQQNDVMQNYDKNDFEVTESMIYYLNHTASVEILTKFELMKVYFPIPKACVKLNKSLSQRIIDEMTETKPHESIKYICYKAMLIKQRLEVQKETNNFSRVSQLLINNVDRLSNLFFLFLFVYLIFEIIDNIEESSISDLGFVLTSFILLIISILILFSGIVDSYHMKKAEITSKNALSHKKKNIEGSLGYNAFSKNINNTEVNLETPQSVKKRRIIFGLLLDH